jgi:hypothetical protein
MTIYPKHGSTTSDDTLTFIQLAQKIADNNNQALSPSEMVEKFGLYGQASSITEIITNNAYQFIQEDGDVTRFYLKWPDNFSSTKK